ncbi:MAG TPA: DinB family protein, partial [Blastocatellia bacterium]|nr:DinB family protein [Blastocatellia bacterium]
MKTLLSVMFGILVFVSSAAGARGQALSQADRDRALQYLETTRKNIIDATRGLSDAQWHFKPSPFRWSVAQVMEHIAAAEDFLRGIEEDRVLKAPPAPGRDIKQLDEKVLATIPDRALNK